MRSLMLTLALLGCGDATQSALTVATRTPTAIEGTFVDGATTLRFAAAEVSPNVIDLQFDVGDLSFTSSVDFTLGSGEIGSSQQRLFTAQDGDRMVALYHALADVIPAQDSRSRAEDALMREISLIAVAPRDELIPHLTFFAQRSWTYISCTCSVQYIGSGYYRWAGRYCNGGCPGMCGVGCDLNGHGAYTQDCAKHDYSLGSWFSASDDYLFAPWNC